jgi:hypothetical protein
MFRRSIPDEFAASIMTPSNVHAAIIYTDGDGNWWGDVCVKNENGFAQFGVPTDQPCRSYKGALDRVKQATALIKGMPDNFPFGDEDDDNVGVICIRVNDLFHGSIKQ